MSQAERTLRYLWSIAPDGATNAAIARRLHTTPQTAYMLMQDLLGRGLVRAERQGRTWVFYALDEVGQGAGVRASGPMGGSSSPVSFRALARQRLEAMCGVSLLPGIIPGIRKHFDFVSPDRHIVGDAMYALPFPETALPGAGFALISEALWLLEKTGAATTFFVVGNDREVPVLWLERYGSLVRNIALYVLDDDAHLELLSPVNTSLPEAAPDRS